LISPIEGALKPLSGFGSENGAPGSHDTFELVVAGKLA
jgi:hypothetical protein